MLGGWGKVGHYPKARGEAKAVVEEPVAASDGRAVLAFFLVQLHDALRLVEDDHLALAAPSNSEGGGARCVRGLRAATRRLGGARWAGGASGRGQRLDTSWGWGAVEELMSG